MVLGVGVCALSPGGTRRPRLRDPGHPASPLQHPPGCRLHPEHPEDGVGIANMELCLSRALHPSTATRLSPVRQRSRSGERYYVGTENEQVAERYT